MKTILSILLTFLIIMPSLVLAAGSCTVTYSGTQPIEKITISCTGDSSAGTFPDTTTKVIRGWVLAVETNPGSTGPTDNYDIVLNTATGVDVMGGALANRDVANTERAVPAVSGWVDNSALTQVVTNSNVNSATFTNTIWYWRQD